LWLLFLRAINSTSTISISWQTAARFEIVDDGLFNDGISSEIVMGCGRRLYGRRRVSCQGSEAKTSVILWASTLLHWAIVSRGEELCWDFGRRPDVMMSVGFRIVDDALWTWLDVILAREIWGRLK